MSDGGTGAEPASDDGATRRPLPPAVRWRDRFLDAERIAGSEGQSTYAATADGAWWLIHCSSLSEFIGNDSADPKVTVARFDDERTWRRRCDRIRDADQARRNRRRSGEPGPREAASEEHSAIARRPPAGLVRDLGEAGHKAWCDWVDGRIPGFPDDDAALLDAQRAASRRLRASYGEPPTDEGRA